jgi:hypothetical protein
MSTFSRRAEPPEAGWFQIGDMPEEAAPGGAARVVCRSAWCRTSRTLRLARRSERPALKHVNMIAGSALGRVVELRYGALALCALALVLLTIVIVTIASHGRSASPSMAVVHHVQVQVTQLKSELRSSEQQLAAARAALARAQHATASTGASGATSHHPPRKGGKR